MNGGRLGMLDLVAPFALGALVQLGVACALYAWGGWVARRRGGTRFWRLLRWMPIAAWALSIVGIGGTCMMLIRAFDAVASADAAQKATLLAAAISDAMNVTAIFVVPSWLFYLVSVVAFLVGSVRAPVEVHDDPQGSDRTEAL